VLVEAIAIVRVDEEEHGARAFVKMSPQRTDLVAAADFPRCESDVAVCKALDVEADGRNCEHQLAELELVEQRGLAHGIKSDHEQP
jgi:hypothetical protein